MAYNQKIAYRHNNCTTRKILYTKVLIEIRMVELSKQPLSIVCRGKEKN